MPKNSDPGGQHPGERIGFLAAGKDHRFDYIGGLLITTRRGRPLEFHYSLPIRPTETHRVLFGTELEPHIFETLIGKSLLDHSQQQILFVVTDQSHVLGIRTEIEVPMVAVSPSSDEANHHISAHRDFANDSNLVADWLSKHPDLDISEPLQRIWDALRDVLESDSRIAA